MAIVAGLGLKDSLPWHETDTATPPTSSPSPKASNSTVPATPPKTPTAQPTQTPAPEEFTIVATGDILTHQPVLNSARHGESYDLTSLWGQIDPWVAGADLALCHLEVPLVPLEQEPTGYPLFGAPTSVAEDIAAQGWDGCSTASNHSVDQGWKGVKTTLNTFDDIGLGRAGTSLHEEEATLAQYYVLERAEREVKVAHIAGTYGLNGLPTPIDKPWSVTLFDAETPDVSHMINLAKKARDDGADLVLASIHCCVEYQTDPTPAQKRVMQDLADSQTIDMVIGHHAHVPQPLTKYDGGPNQQGMWVSYGLGNYISNQSDACCVPETASGLLLSATATVPHEGAVNITDMQWTGVTVDHAAGHQMYVLTEDGKTQGHLSEEEMTTRYERVRSAVGDEMTERTEPPNTSGSAAEMITRSRTNTHD